VCDERSPNEVNDLPRPALTPEDRSDLPLTLVLFGTLQVELGGRDVTAQLPGRQGRALVAYLVLNEDRPVSRDELLNVLWPAQLPAAPEAALSSVLAKVRRALGPDLIKGRQALVLEPPPDAHLDVHAVDEQTERAEGALAQGDPGAALEAAEAVLDVLARPLLPDLDGHWIEAWRRRFDETALRALEVAAEAGLALGERHLPAAERAAAELVAGTGRGTTGGRRPAWDAGDDGALGALDAAHDDARYGAPSFHGSSETWTTSSSTSPPTARIARSTSPSANSWVVSRSSGKRREASCASASSTAR
jgi:hypothetical protein